MIDFRYHIVSLISVFLALAVGIALGAGPLKETIGDTLTGQVERLRTEKDGLRTNLDETTVELGQSDDYLAAAAPQLVAGSLQDRRIAVVQLGAVPADEVAALDTQLVAAGATITAHVTVEDSWTDPDLRSYRQALVGSLADFMAPVPAADAAVDTALAEALVQSVTRFDPAAPDALAEPASILTSLLSEGDNALVTFAAPVTVAADAVVVVAPRVAEGAVAATPAPTDSAATTAQLAILRAGQTLSQGAVLADGPLVDGSLTKAVMADSELAATLTTVSGTQRLTGQISVPLALNARIAGTTGHYGFAEGQTTMPTRVELTPVDRTPQPAVEPTAPDPALAGAGSQG